MRRVPQAFSAGTRPAVLVAVLVPVLLVAACAAGPNDAANAGTQQLAGFWLGLWQGLICPITFVVSLFNDQVSMYEVHNNGGWYDFGFLLGVMVIFSGGGAGSRETGRRGRNGSRTGRR